MLSKKFIYIFELKSLNSHYTNSISAVFLILSSIFLTGCEAPLKLDAVIGQESKASHRSDRFQQINSNDSSVVVVGSFGVILVSNDEGDT